LIGDSKVIIDWLNQSGSLHSTVLIAWMEQIRLLQCSFKNLIFTHASREYNGAADLLSKKALEKTTGFISYNQWLGGT
jgi:hypothetical protein